MLGRLARTASRQTGLDRLVAGYQARRSFVQPSGADRASVVDVPSTYKDEGHFTPRAGLTIMYSFCSATHRNHFRHAWFQIRSPSA